MHLFLKSCYPWYIFFLIQPNVDSKIELFHIDLINRCFRFKKANADMCIKNTFMSKLKIKNYMRPMGLNSHLSLQDSTLTSCHICISTDPSNSLLVIIQLVFPMPKRRVEDFNKICKHKPPLWPNPSTKLPYPEGHKINNFCMPFPGHHYNILTGSLSDLFSVEKRFF